MSCDIYSNNLFASANLADISISNKSSIQNLFVPYRNSISGIWLPIIIKPLSSKTTYCELLASASDKNSAQFNPCNCDNSIFGDGSGVSDISNSQEQRMGDLSECSYCNSKCTAENADPCDMDLPEEEEEKQFCDVRFNKDDYIPKIPYVYQGYISGFNDFKHMGQFPSCSNPGLGIEKFISLGTFSDLPNSAGRIYIDWKLQESISEIPYDAYSSQHDTEYVHNKAFTKSLNNKTCGNFIDITGVLPTEESFTKPHGFSNQTYDNIFFDGAKQGSHWKWNYQSGIMGWYRHYDTNRSYDKRPFKGVDLFIPSGDVFYAKNVGPESPQAEEEADTACPSGLKLVNGGVFNKIIPNNTEFIYISTNIYSKVLEAQTRLENAEITDDLLSKSVLLATHPEYDNIITDLLDPSIKENRNDIGQLTTLNQYMTSGTDFKSVGRVNYCRNNEDLVKTLLHKYGCYLFLEPKTTHTIDFPISVQEADSYYIDMSFDMVIKKNTNKFNLYSSYDTSSKFLPNVPNYKKQYVYNQEIKVGSQNLIKTYHNLNHAYDESCTEPTGVDATIDSPPDYRKENNINVSYLNAWGDQASLGRLSNNSGHYSFTDRYQEGRLNHDRVYPAAAFNPHVDLVAVHSQGGLYANALPFSVRQKSVFTSSVTSSPGGNISVIFRNKDCGIKIYEIKASKLQSKKEISKQCLRFPYSIEESCKCYGFGSNFYHDNLNRDFEAASNIPQTIYGIKSYVPGLSTKNSPKLKEYGGYSVDYMNNLFGANGHQQKQKPDLITNLDNYKDPVYAYGTPQQTSITLPNYVNSKWTLNTKKFESNSHVDVVVHVSENVSLTANRFTGDPASEDYLSNHNMAWKKFTTRVKIGGRTLYNQQANSISVSLNQQLTVDLHNPFLGGLVNDTQTVYGAPDNSENLFSSSPKLYSSRGDESSEVTLTFSKVPRKQVLSFVIPPPTSYGTLSKGRFKPDKGLTTSTANKSPFINNRLYTEYGFVNKGDADLENNKGIYYSSITENMRKLCHQVSNFKMGRKLKLYVRKGSSWCGVGTQKLGGYTQNNIQYIGRPRFFEYISNTNNSQQIPLLFPVPPAKLEPWEFHANHAVVNTDSVYNHHIKGRLLSSYPSLNGLTANVSLNKIVMGGSRYYFLADENIKVVSPTKTVADPDGEEGDTIAIEIDNIKDIDKLSIDIDMPTGSVVKIGSVYYFYNGGTRTVADSYLLLGDSYEEILSMPSSLDVDFGKMADSGYIYNSFKPCDQKIIVYLNNNGYITPIKNRYKIVSKKLVVQGYGADKRPVVKNPVYHKLLTVFEINENLNPVKDKIFSIDIQNKDISTSLCLFHPVDDLDKDGLSTDFSKYLSFNYKGMVPIYDADGNIVDHKYDILKSYRTKWADILGLSDPKQMSASIVDTLDIKSLFPDSPYNNWFYKQIINSFQSRCNFELYIRDKYSGALSKAISFNNVDVTYCILQKYNLEKPVISQLKNADIYQNFIPMMDISLHNRKLPEEYWNLAGRYNGSNTGIPLQGIIYSPNFTRDLSKSEFDILPNDLDSKTSSDLFWTEVTDKDTIETSFVPTTTVYSDTLRLDDPLFWLDATTKKTTTSTAGVRTTFTPTAPTMSSAGLTLPGFSHKIKTRDYAFSIHNIYGDGDEFEKCGAQDYSTCFMSTRGSVSLHAKIKMATEVQQSSLHSSASFFTTYDAGSYNPLGQRNIISIARSELKGDNPLDSAYDHCSTSYLRPDYKRTFIDPERKKTLAEGRQVAHSLATKNLDAYANEMLFRIMYGDDGDPVNRAILLSKKKPLNVEDLVNFTDPKVTAADVYDEILYNYDRTTTCGVSGSFSVRGPMKIGDSYDFTIGNKNIYFSVEDYGGGDIRAVGRIGGKTFNVKLAGGSSVKTGVTVTDVETTLNNTENTTYTLKKTSSGSTTKYYGSVAGRIYTGTYAIAVRDYGIVKKYGMCLGQAVGDIGHHGSQVPPNSSVSSIPIHNGGTEFDNWVGGAKVNIRWGTGSSSGGGCANKTCDDYEIGYCKRKSGCNTDVCDGEEDMENFLYTFKQCRTTFNVYGHKYKILNAEEGEEEEEEEEEEPTPADDDDDDDSGTISLAGGGRVSLNCPAQSGRAREEGGCLIECGGVRGASSTIAGSCTRAGKNCCNSTGAIFASRRRVDELDRAFAAQYGTWPGPGPHPEYQQYQYDTGMRPSTRYPENNDSPMTGDPGYDVCGFATHSVSIPARKYWKYKTVTSSGKWDGRCPRHVCSISYTSNSLSITIGAKTTCITNSLTKCPSLEAQMPAHSTISSENSNTTNTSNDLEINLPTQKQTFQTLTYTHKEYLGGMSGADVNPLGAVSTARSFKCGLFSSYGCISSAAYALCGGNTWWHSSISDSRGTFGMALASWKSRMTEAFNNIDSEIGAEFSWHPKGPPAAAGDGGAERARHKCNANNHISSSDIVQGIIPGTCSDIQFETISKSYGKYGYDGYEIVSSTATQYTVRAYITYSYKRPVTIQDKLKGWSADNDSYACAQEGKNRTSQHNEGAQDDYPEWYAQSLGLETRDTLGYPIQNYGGSSNYVRRKVEVSKSSSCGENLTSYTPDDYNKGANAKYPYGGAPCGRNDYLCWSKNRDWIRVWTDDE